MIRASRIYWNKYGEPNLTIRLEGAFDVYRFAHNMTSQQCEFAAQGRKILRGLRRRWGRATFHRAQEQLHGEVVHEINERALFVYRLVVEIPDELLARDYVPPALLESERWRDWDEQPFTWPRRRNFFSAEAAQRRAHKLREWGANVRVEYARIADWTPWGVPA